MSQRKWDVRHRLHAARHQLSLQCGQIGRNANKIPRHTSEVNYVRMVLHCAMFAADSSHVSNVIIE